VEERCEPLAFWMAIEVSRLDFSRWQTTVPDDGGFWWGERRVSLTSAQGRNICS